MLAAVVDYIRSSPPAAVQAPAVTASAAAAPAAVQVVQLPPAAAADEGDWVSAGFGSGLNLETSTPVEVGSPIDVDTPVEQVNLAASRG